MPIFGLSKNFGVGRGLKVFLNLQAGATRGKVPNPWHSQDRATTSREKDQQIYRLKNQVKEQREIIFQLENELRSRDESAGNAQASPSAPRTSGGEVGSLPDFVVIGTMRGGTSRFYSLLTRHPFVEGAATKELHFFDNPERYERGLEWYRGCFPSPEEREGHRTITGEATPMYLYDPEVPERMARAVPDAKLFVLLRNPVDRALSQYYRSVRNGAETRPFAETVEEELASLAGNSGSRYTQLARGIYVDQLARWREHFAQEQMLVIKSEDFYARQAETLKDAEDFLGLPHREIEIPARKTSRQPIHEYEPMDPALRQRLEGFFEPHNKRLYEYLGRDFGW